MITRILIKYILLASLAQGAVVELLVMDEIGEPIKNAKAKITFANYSGRDETITEEASNSSGEIRAFGSSNHSILIKISKSGHYAAELERLAANQDHKIEVILPRVVDPRGLIHRKTTPKIPDFDRWFGFDMEFGDWLVPVGRGETADFFVRLSRNFVKINLLERDMIKIRDHNPNYTEDDLRRIWGLWNMFLEIRFEGKDEGITESDQFYHYSEMQLPHSAPDSDYKPELIFENISNNWSSRNKDIGYFIKSRVVTDASGRFVSANYSKLIGELRSDGGGSFFVEYYFNPDPNDRNLEYNGTNLAETQK